LKLHSNPVMAPPLLRVALVLLIVASSAAFVVATTIERHSGEAHHAGTGTISADSGTSSTEGGGESSEATTTEHSAETTAAETHAELRPLGVNIEAVPFVALVTLFTLLLAVGAWLRPRRLALLVVIGVTMLAFAVLDIREVFHQHDEGRTGLAVLAGAIALLHLGAAAVDGLMARDARRPAATG
jgi:Flp pilus assembly protein TadB